MDDTGTPAQTPAQAQERRRGDWETWRQGQDNFVIANSLGIGMILVMKTTITVDEVGRLVLPKVIREAVGISGRMTVNIEVVDNAARISAPEKAARAVARRRGRLVYTGALPESWESGEAVLRMRERRLRR